jgi:hypothetical protein
LNGRGAKGRFISFKNENRDWEDGILLIIKICRFPCPKIEKLAILAKQ